MPTILLHAIGLDADSWRFAAIPGGVAMDLPGFGRQPVPERPLDMDGIADDVIARAPDGPLDVVGVSLGSMVAMHAGLRHRDRVRSLVLACAAASSSPDVMRQRAEAVRTEGVAAQVPGTIDRWFTEAALADAAHPAVRYARERLASDDPVAFEQGWLAIAGHDVRADLPSLDIPVTVIGGRQDRGATVEAVTALQSLLPNSRLVLLEGPHMLYMEHPREFADAVAAHLRWVEG
jgi:pimeloyl-ACP methyl ester carboxylesterase